MGCTQSKIENEEAVTRCKLRKQHMKDAVGARNHFAAAHSSYTMALKNTGAALSDFGQGEVEDPQSHAQPGVGPTTAPVSQPPLDNLPPPPPPLPDFPAPPLIRSASMPDLPIPKSDPHPSETIPEEEDQDEEDDAAGPTTPTSLPPPPPGLPSEAVTPPQPPLPEPDHKGDAWDFFFPAMHDSMPGPSLPEPEVEVAPPPPPRRVKDDGIKSKSDDVVNDNSTVERMPEKVITEPVAKTTKKQKQVSSGGGGSSSSQHGGGGSEGSKRGKAAAAANTSLLEILKKLDDHFLGASESAHEVSKMLEANRLHYHSNFADNRGHIDHSARVMRVITWNRSFRGIPNPDEGKDDFDREELETHATVLDKLLAWEKKLYDEVKAGELMKLEYQRKVVLLNKQKKRGTSSESLEKTKAAVSHLHTRYIVDMQSLDSTVSEIHRLRDHQLYPKLVELVDGMAEMWEAMHHHHEVQQEMVVDLRSLHLSNDQKETSLQHHNQTRQLCRILGDWHSHFSQLINHQKEYIHALNNWLKLTLIPIESSLKEKVSSPPRTQHPPIEALLRAWHEQLEKLPVELARGPIFSFSAVMNSIMVHQDEELKQKEKWEDVSKEYSRKLRQFEDWHHKYSQRRTPASESMDDDQDRAADGGTQPKDPIAERMFVVETLKKRMEEEMETYQKLRKQVREKSLGSLKTHLPELFRAITEFASACSETYRRLQAISHSQGHGSPD
ncbi:protein ROLLING AND ERECT LEAF 2-like isoform X2 [Magnolia sinica]|uniref:protein ROLLING AND ERECT LEAF 2-like isoform X2 n=1 Tax=Magnolia sinica TaxID=86752 RepID=UPI0026594E5D|nr:protein ROLLING AND ERECT LEAF 2-like isoform X2 [Magnolia sinica]